MRILYDCWVVIDSVIHVYMNVHIHCTCMSILYTYIYHYACMYILYACMYSRNLIKLDVYVPFISVWNSMECVDFKLVLKFPVKQPVSCDDVQSCFI